METLEFRNETMKSFNAYRDTNLKSGMTFDEAVHEIEIANNDYFYISACKEDVIEAYKEEEDLAKQIVLEFVCIDNWIFIALGY